MRRAPPTLYAVLLLVSVTPPPPPSPLLLLLLFVGVVVFRWLDKFFVLGDLFGATLGLLGVKPLGAVFPTAFPKRSSSMLCLALSQMSSVLAGIVS